MMRLARVMMLLSFASSALAQEGLTGRASVVDGDTLEIRGERIRLHGIDAPESGQWCLDANRQRYRCGQKSAFALADQIGTASVRCEALDTDQYGRTVARCYLGALDLNGWAVEGGHALAFRNYSTDYVADEDSARAAKRGLWGGSFDPPWEWRKGIRPIHSAILGEDDQRPKNCAIKGNINRKDARIFHVPGQRGYGNTKVSPEKGERWFCSEQEAMAAGWRKAQN